MSLRARWCLGAIFLAPGLPAGGLETEPVSPDLTAHSETSGIGLRVEGTSLVARWPTGGAETGRLALSLLAGRPLIDDLSLEAGEATSILSGVDPVFFLTIGTRKGTPGRPPSMSPWNEFFDSPATRPHESHASRFRLKTMAARSEGRRTAIRMGEIEIGPFRGDVVVTLYAGSRLVHIEAVVSTSVDGRAIIYDAALVGEPAAFGGAAWVPAGKEGLERAAMDPARDEPIAVRHRALIAERGRGSIALFPPPHQYQFPRDWTDNLKFVWFGRGHLGLEERFGMGVRQAPSGGGNFVPWFNAPPGTAQHLGFFALPVRGGAEDALRETLRYTRGDRFARIPGHITFTSHYHMAVAVVAMERKARGDATIPDYVGIFKAMGVNAVHQADFHGDGHQKDPGPIRFPELAALFEECRKYSDDELLLIPGEEVNEYLGMDEEGKHPGHWMSLFPKPVYWSQKREAGLPFEEEHPDYGKIYRVGSREDMVALVAKEKALVWAAHPRIKASSWTPDIFRHEDFYRADSWVGGAWKAMPADLSRDRLGERGLDLLDDMANWGGKKYLPGEVDVFKIDRTHELFGHMNINYVRLPELPRFDDGWAPILDALEHGRFFVTTGEVLIPEWTVGGKASGETLAAGAGEAPEMKARLEWTFPLRFAEVISGDGKQVFRDRIELGDTEPFGNRVLSLRPNLVGRKWVRFEVWDIAVNGAFTQPVWLEGF